MSRPICRLPHFWYVHATGAGGCGVALAVAAVTALSARRQVRTRLGPGATIHDVTLVRYAHAWVIDHVGPLLPEPPA